MGTSFEISKISEPFFGTLPLVLKLLSGGWLSAFEVHGTKTDKIRKNESCCPEETGNGNERITSFVYQIKSYNY